MKENQTFEQQNEFAGNRARRASAKIALSVAALLLVAVVGANLPVNVAQAPRTISSGDAANIAALSDGANLTVRVKGLRNTKGTVRFYIYNNEAAWKASEKDGPAFRELSAEVRTGAMAKNNESVVVFKDLPAGTYAVSILHDENNNNKMDSTLGIPTEGYGMSNNPKIGMSMPKWDDCKFDVTDGEQTIEIKAFY